MKYEITAPDAVKQELWQEISIYVLAGGFKLDTTNLRSDLTTLPKGALLNVNHTTRVATLVKSAEVYEELGANGTALKVKKTNQFKAGEFIGLPTKAVEISAIDTTNSSYDAITLSAALDSEAIPVGTVLFEAAAASDAGAAASEVNLVDGSGETLKVQDPEGHDDLKVVIAQAADDNLAVAYADQVLTISLADTTATKNTGALIQAAIRDLDDADGYDFSRFVVTTSASWDTSATGDTLGTASGYLTYGVIGIDVAPKSVANCINYHDVTIEGTPSVNAIARAYEVKEAKLPYPVHAKHKETLTSRFFFV